MQRYLSGTMKMAYVKENKFGETNIQNNFCFLWVHLMYLCPPNRRGGGHIVFGADPVGVGVGVGVSVGVGVRVASFPDVIFWTDGRILTKLAQIHCCEGGTSWLDFGDLGPIFKVTATFFNVWNFVSGRYLLNQWTDFDQTCIDTMLGGCEELVRFWWPWPNFQGHSDLL